MTDERLINALAHEIVRQRREYRQKVKSILEDDGRLKATALLRIKYMLSQGRYEVIDDLIKSNIIRSADDLKCQMQECRLLDDSNGGQYAYCDPLPMSDDVMDNGRNLSYLHTTRQTPEEANA